MLEQRDVASAALGKALRMQGRPARVMAEHGRLVASVGLRPHDGHAYACGRVIRGYAAKVAARLVASERGRDLSFNPVASTEWQQADGERQTDGGRVPRRAKK